MKEAEPMLPSLVFLPWRVPFVPAVFFFASLRSLKPKSTFLTVIDFQTCSRSSREAPLG